MNIPVIPNALALCLFLGSFFGSVPGTKFGWMVGSVAEANQKITLKFVKNDREATSLFKSPASPQKIKQLKKVKRFRDLQDYKGCLDLSFRLRMSVPQLRNWLTVAYLQCSKSYLIKNKGNLTAFENSLAKIEKKPGDFLVGSHVESLRSYWVEVKLILLDRQLKENRKGAWKTVNQMMKHFSWLSPSQKGHVYRVAGELSMIEQKLKPAKFFMLESLKVEDSEFLRSRLRRINRALGEKVDVGVEDKNVENPDLEASDEELKIFERITIALRSGEIISGAEDCMRLITEYPGGRRAKWAVQRIEEIYFGVASKKEEKYQPLKAKILELMARADGQRLFEWAESAHKKGKYGDALLLAEESLKKVGSMPLVTKVKHLAAKAAHYSGVYEKALRHYKNLTDRDSGTPQAVDAFFNIGLIEYRRGNYSSAIAFLERFLVIPGSDKYKLNGMYWLWRSLQKVNKANAAKMAKKIADLYPQTYYGLRAQGSLNQGFVKLSGAVHDVKKMNYVVYLTPRQYERWKKFETLFRAGWISEASKEFEILPIPQGPEEMMVIGSFYGLMGKYEKASRLINQAMLKNPQLDSIEFARIIFPKMFSEMVKKYSSRRGYSDILTFSLIRQESAFDYTAKSRAGARGLMQLIPGTSDQMARELRLKGYSSPEDSYVPRLNIAMGTYYLSKLLKGFRQNVPVSLAAYNTGPTRLRRWLKGRNLLQPILDAETSDPSVEIWIDEMPWSETRFYVKAILRNFLIYNMLDKGLVKLTNPTWKPLLSSKLE